MASYSFEDKIYGFFIFLYVPVLGATLFARSNRYGRVSSMAPFSF